VGTLRGKVKKIKWLRGDEDKPGKSGKPLKSTITDKDGAKMELGGAGSGLGNKLSGLAKYHKRVDIPPRIVEIFDDRK